MTMMTAMMVGACCAFYQTERSRERSRERETDHTPHTTHTHTTHRLIHGYTVNTTASAPPTPRCSSSFLTVTWAENNWRNDYPDEEEFADEVELGSSDDAGELDLDTGDSGAAHDDGLLPQLGLYSSTFRRFGDSDDNSDQDEEDDESSWRRAYRTRPAHASSRPHASGMVIIDDDADVGLDSDDDNYF